MVVVGAQRFQRIVRIEHTAAAGAQHVPGEIEQAEPRGMQEAGNHPFFVEPTAPGKIQDVDAIELVVFALVDQLGDSVRDCRIGSLLQNGKLGLYVAHDLGLIGVAGAAGQPPYRGVMPNIGERSGCVVTTPTGITGSWSRSVTRYAPMILASANVASTSAKCAPTQIRAPTPNGR